VVTWSRQWTLVPSAFLGCEHALNPEIKILFSLLAFLNFYWSKLGEFVWISRRVIFLDCFLYSHSHHCWGLKDWAGNTVIIKRETFPSALLLFCFLGQETLHNFVAFHSGSTRAPVNIKEKQQNAVNQNQKSCGCLASHPREKKLITLWHKIGFKSWLSGVFIQFFEDSRVQLKNHESARPASCHSWFTTCALTKFKEK